MAFDGTVICALTGEINKAVEGGKIDKIHQPEKSELILHIRKAGEAYKLLLCANPSFPRIHFTNSAKENPQSPPMFCMLLRKHLSGGKITGVYQDGFERIVKIDIESYDEMGYLSVKTLVIEMMGKYSNIILINPDGKIIDSIHHVDFTVSSVRQVLPGLIYEAPKNHGKVNPLNFDTDGICEFITDGDMPVSKILMNSFTGISPLIANEAVYRATGSCDTVSSQILPPIRKRCAQCLVNILSDVKSGNTKPCIVYDENAKKYVDFSAAELVQYRGILKFEYFDSMNTAVDAFYSKKAAAESMKQKSGDLLKFVNGALDRCTKKLQLQNEILQKTKKREKYKMYGDLLTANIYLIKQGMKDITVQNFYLPDAQNVTIPLKGDLTPSENCQRYYKRYTKDKTAEIETKKQKKLNEIEIDYLESVQEAILKAENSAEISQIREELTEQGYLKLRGKPKKSKKQTVFKPMHFVSSDGYDIYTGKNNRQNDYVTLKIGRSTDIWFHTKNIHGSHTIVKCDDAEKVPETTYNEAASIAAYYSKARNSKNVPVDYTEVKNVKKPSGAKPGMVIYVDYSTAYVNPDENLINKLKKE